MPILKTEILGTVIEISYEKNEYDKLNNLIEKFKIRLSQFPNVEANEKDLQNKNIVIENLNKEIILLKKELDKIQSSNISHIQDNTSVLDKIKELGKKTKLIQDRIKESVK